MKTDKAKTKEEILNQEYVNAYDVMVLNPYMSYARARKLIDEIRKEMKDKYYVPEGKTKVALTRLLRKKCGF